MFSRTPLRASLVVAIGVISCLTACTEPALTEKEKRVFSSFSLTRLSAPDTSSNRVASNTAAATLGKQLFHDPRLSSSGSVSCASCHQTEKHFTDGLAKARGIGTLNRNTPSLSGAAWNQWQYWDGRRDSLWSQALTPLEAKDEMGSNRVAIVRLLLEDADYKRQYQALFGNISLRASELAIDASPVGSEQEKRAWFDFPTRKQESINTVFANIGKSIGAFEQTLAPVTTRFDQFVEQVKDGKPYNNILSKQELRGARLFINSEKTQCLECHNGPLLSNGDFHNIGSGRFNVQPGEQLDFGRIFGVQAAMINEFNCQGRFSDAGPDNCEHLRFLNRGAVAHMHGAFRTPTLRNVVNTGPYFHDGRFDTLQQVVLHYAATPAPEKNTGAATAQNELRPFKLTEKEVRAITAFLKSLAPVDNQHSNMARIGKAPDASDNQASDNQPSDNQASDSQSTDKQARRKQAPHNQASSNEAS